jgi:steroid delta-isomerase
MSGEHPAMVAARSSWRCVQAKDKEGWLALMTDDICIEDPIGVAPTNPTGKGLRGKAEVADFYEKNIAPATLRIEPHESYAAGDESAHLMTLTTSFPNGVTMTVRGIFTYRVDDAGKLTNLRGYWTLADAKVEQPS